MFLFDLKPKNKQKNQDSFSSKEQGRRLYSWKNLRTAREPQKTQIQRRLWELKRSLNERTLPFFKTVMIFGADHWHLLVKSAAKNHLRIQECKAKPSPGEFCNLNFESYTHLKRYQKKVRILTFSTSSTIVSVVLAMLVVQLFFPSLKSKGATFIFNQTSWSGGVTGNGASHGANQTGWNQYGSKDANIVVVNGGNDLQMTLPAVQSVTDDSDAQFDGTQAGDGFYTDGTGKLYLKKPQSAACTLAVQCASGTCTGNVCQ